mgnify:CR=1 FL=1
MEVRPEVFFFPEVRPFVVDFFGDMESTFDAISRVANPFLDDEIQLSMMPYSMDFAKNAVKGVEPFYRKEN